MGHLLCFLSPSTCATHAVAKSVLSGFFTRAHQLDARSVEWFLDAAGGGADLGQRALDHRGAAASRSSASWSMLAAPLLMLGLLVATLQAVRHGDGPGLWRVYFGVAPACVLAIVVARPLATLDTDGGRSTLVGASPPRSLDTRRP